MSRIDEALRRAGSPIADESPTVTPQDFPTLGPRMPDSHLERFPVEKRAQLYSASNKAPLAASAPAGSVVSGVPVTPALKARWGEPSSIPDTHPVQQTLGNRTSHLGNKLIIHEDATPAFIEQYRKLAALVCQAQTERSMQIIMIASALPGEGKTLTACNLALTLSESYRQSVLLVDADLRNPTVHQVFQIPNESGLDDAVASESPSGVRAVKLTPHLTVLPAARAVADPMAVLSSAGMKRLLRDAAEKFSWVIVDTPPVAVLPDAGLLSHIVDGAVLVVQAGKTPYKAVLTAIEGLRRERILGVLLNQANPSSDDLAYHYDRRYTSTGTEQSK